jgi:hypothetical protein
MSAIKPEITTYEDFKRSTNPMFPRKSLAGVDDALKKWATVKDGASKDQRVKQLRVLANACVAYVSAKETKKQTKESAKGKKPSDRLLNRMARVKALTGETFLRLAFEQYDYQKSVAGGAQHQNLAVARTNLADLKGTYKHERSNFVNTKALSGLKGTQTAINPQGASFVHQKIDENKAVPMQVPANIAAMLTKGFDHLSLNEFNALQSHFSQGQQGLGHLPNVHFARKDERFRELMLVPLDGLLRTSSGDVCDVKWNAYALDCYGNLLVAKANRSWTHGQSGAQFNHSTLAAGRDVICAGEIKIEKGLIKYISNESGHYKPTSAQLANAILVLSEEYLLPVFDSLEEIVDVSSGAKVSYNTTLSFMATNPGLV